MIVGLMKLLIVACLIVLPGTAAAAKPVVASACYRAADAVPCFIAAAKLKLKQVTRGDDRADAVGEILYTLAATNGRDAAMVQAATELAASRAVRPVKQMDLFYALDLYASAADTSAQPTYVAALGRFAALEKELKGNAQVELYVNACSIIAWQEPFGERWHDFARSVCAPAKLQALKPDNGVYQALLLAMLPVAATLAADRDAFAASTDYALLWLHASEKAAAKSKKGGDKDFVAFIGVLIHTMNSLCLDAFDEPDAADDEIDVSLKVLRRMELRVGVSGRSTPLRRQVVESLFYTGREAAAKEMLGQMLKRVDGDTAGRVIPFAEQIAILLLAAKLEYDERHDSERLCVPDGGVEI